MNNHLTPLQMLAYNDEELSETETLHVTEHLSGCESCLTEMKRLRNDLATTKDVLCEQFSRGLPPAPKPWEPLNKLLEQGRSGLQPSVVESLEVDEDGGQEQELDSE